MIAQKWLHKLRCCSDAERRRVSVSQWQDFSFADVDDAAGIVMLECEVACGERLGKVHVFVQLVVIDGYFDPSHLAASPDGITDFDLVREPRVRLHKLLVDVTNRTANPFGLDQYECCRSELRSRRRSPACGSFESTAPSCHHR
jgi:hypothetical protein